MPKFKRKMKKNQELKIIREVESGNPRRVEIGKICGFLKDSFVKNTDYFAGKIDGKSAFVWHNGEDVFFKFGDSQGKIILLQDIDLAMKILEGAVNNEYSK